MPANDADIRGIIATAIRFADGTVLDFSEMESPEAGSILMFGSTADDTGFVYAGDQSDITDTTAPEAPSNFSATASINLEGIEGEAQTGSISMAWDAPTANEDDSECTDLAGFVIESSLDGVTYIPQLNVDKSAVGATLAGFLSSTLVYVRIAAYDSSGNYSEWATASATSPAVAAPPDVTTVTLAAVASGIVSATITSVARKDLLGFIYQKNYTTTDGGTDWVGWGADTLVTCNNGTSPVFFISAPARKNFKIQVKAIVYGNVKSTNWTASNTVTVTGISESDFTGGALVSGTNTLRYTKDALVSYQSATQYAGFGLIGGSFYGLYVAGGAIQVTSASGTLTLNSNGISHVVSGETKFAITSSGLAITGADITVSGGSIVVQSTDANNQLKMDSTYGIRCLVSGSAVVTISKAGIELASTTDGIWCKNGSSETVMKMNRDGILLDSTTNGIRVQRSGKNLVTLNASGVHVFDSDGTTEIVSLGYFDSTYGLKVTKGTISGATITGSLFRTSALGENRIEIQDNGSDVGEIEFYGLAALGDPILASVITSYDDGGANGIKISVVDRANQSTLRGYIQLQCGGDPDYVMTLVEASLHSTQNSRVFAKRSAQQFIEDAVYETVVWDTEVEDVRGELASGVFTAKEAGFYLVSAQVVFALTTYATQELVQSRLMKNTDTLIAYGSQWRNFTAATSGNVYADTRLVGVVVELAALDTLEFQVYNNRGSTGTYTLDSAEWNYISIVRCA